MSGAGSSALSRTDRLWPAVAASLVVHGLVFGLFAAVRPAPTLDPGQRPMMARLVRLGEARQKELLPRKEAPPPPAPESPAPAAAPAPSPAAPAPAPSVPAARAAPVAKPAAPRAAQAGAEKPGRPGGSRLASVVSQLKQEIQAGQPDGSPFGEASESEGDPYLAAVYQALRQNYRLPSTISDRERISLQATLVLSVAKDGRILSHEFTRRSGNPTFDEALERAVRQTRLPPPPAASAALYLKGLEVVFRI